MNDELVCEVREGAAFLTINRESKRNALSQELMTAFSDYLEQLDRNEEVRAVCITGAGDKAFCSGADLTATLVTGAQDTLSGARKYAKLLKELARFGKPLLARVNGPCLAGGLGLMLPCDIVIARNDAFFCTPEVNVGIFPMMVGALLVRNVNRKKVFEMVLTGRRIPAPEAERIGLITRAVEPQKLDQEVQKTLKGLTSKSPIGVRMGKEAFRVMSDLSFEDAIDYLCEALGRVLSTEDAMEGIRAFMEQREPNFRGR